MFSKEIFAQRLRALRVASNVTVATLCESIGVTKSAISRFEHGKDNPNCNTLCALADYFNVSLDYLVGRSDVAERR
jgi:transcriptional regulator with XRE-family HTH domain